MADSQIQLTISLIFVALFSVAIIGFAITFASDNDAVINAGDDSDFSNFYSNTKDNYSTFKSQSESTLESLLESTVEPGSDVVQSSAPFSITPTNVIGVVKNLVWLPYKKIFGTGAGFGIFFTVFGGVLVFMIALLIYKTWKGNP